ncbi:hypothetical protein [Paenibacillus hexagrammi]|uniref:Spore coat protein n=1 Tax=Paenibacillus hexagrammi TaxID=2908839 RepID=A0ABY3SN69_9BACL|nr:hypothetical protein [Paenibacillus sp. YPD9-1]UJF34570.1 hypothetical protein L0M14_05170 [Paenibacillus sp. YPD9-1]
MSKPEHHEHRPPVQGPPAVTHQGGHGHGNSYHNNNHDTHGTPYPNNHGSHNIHGGHGQYSLGEGIGALLPYVVAPYIWNATHPQPYYPYPPTPPSVYPPGGYPPAGYPGYPYPANPYYPPYYSGGGVYPTTGTPGTYTP